MKRDAGLSTAVLAGVAGLILLATAWPAQAQIHDLEKKLLGSQGSMNATTQGTAQVCSCSECIYLDTYDPNNTPPGEFIVHTSTTLQAGTPYLLTIRGTNTVWPQAYWIAPGQGPVEAAPEYPSPGAENWAAFADWEYLFAYYKPTPVLPLPSHVVFQGVSLDGGVTYNDLTPLGGQTYHSNHTYQYLIEGQGQPLFVRRHDFPTDDNSGQFKICVQKLSPCGSIADTPTACVDTQGFWGSKPGVTWPSPYSRTAAFFTSGQTWQQVLDTSVNVSPGYYQLADQYIAAVLNQASGASVPSGVQTVLNEAMTWFGADGPSACTAAGSCTDQKNWASTLDSYNNGNYPGGPSACD